VFLHVLAVDTFSADHYAKLIHFSSDSVFPPALAVDAFSINYYPELIHSGSVLELSRVGCQYLQHRLLLRRTYS
jgi:hypothetical protein